MPFPPSVDIDAEVAETTVVDIQPSTEEILSPTYVGAGARVGHLCLLYAGARVLPDAVVGDRCTLRPRCEVKQEAVLGDGCHLAEEAMVGRRASLGEGCQVGEGCGVGTDAELGAGVVLLDRRRLPGEHAPCTVGAGARIGGGAVICGGVTVGKGAIVGAGEVVEDDVPDGVVWMGGEARGSFEGRTWE